MITAFHKMEAPPHEMQAPPQDDHAAAADDDEIELPDGDIPEGQCFQMELYLRVQSS